MITKISPPALIELLSRAMEILIRELGVVDTEYFIAAVQRERFDYTKWQHEHFDKMDLQTFVDKASAYAKQKGPRTSLWRALLITHSSKIFSKQILQAFPLASLSSLVSRLSPDPPSAF